MVLHSRGILPMPCMGPWEGTGSILPIWQKGPAYLNARPAIVGPERVVMKRGRDRPMRSPSLTHLLPLLPLLLSTLTTAAPSCPTFESFSASLKPLLTTSTLSQQPIQRWSDYGAPTPAFIVTINAEADVPAVIKYASTNNLQFLLQSRGNGWADTFNLGPCGILINIAPLNTITFNADKTLATIGGGALTQDMVNAAYGNDTRFANPTCNCLGYLGASLGGGLTRAMGLYGMGVDQLVSANLVLASGESVVVSATQNPDLFFAVRGAVGNFGVITSAVVKAYPVAGGQNGNVAWQGSLTFADNQLEGLVQAIHDLDLQPDMEIDFLFSVSPGVGAAVTAIPIFFGDTAQAEKAFAPILALKPAVANQAASVPYNHWADFGDTFCTPGLRKPVYGSSLSRAGLDPKTWRAVFEEFKTFTTTYPEAVNSSVLAEYYPVQKAVQLGGAYPHRDIPLHIVVIPLYEDQKLDGAAQAFGEKARALLRATDPKLENGTYINFAHGDETLQEIYGESLPKLQQLKTQYDPHNRFNQYFDITAGGSGTQHVSSARRRW
ncbi:uncharacterized protein KY384_000322 [Bacidia gigantensis]|uniref:uncharacterized protein n=1 Tax=Bacidia gigantensis TaxID=2732470 RepID=UPI001D03958A|nr:uncharacterized protein KY384_000322 [Bacidia gigantensis]KAG8526329.1 hypothetical protein KY384_000322 [Bacidia gigantensis]